MFGENHPMLSGQQETRWVFSWKKVLMNQHGFKWVENTLGFFVLPLHLCMFEIFHHKCFFKWISQTRYWAEEARHKKVHTHYRIPCIKLKKKKTGKTHQIYEKLGEWLPLVRTENEWREHMGILGSAGNVLFLDVDNGCKSLFILRKLLWIVHLLCFITP